MKKFFTAAADRIVENPENFYHITPQLIEKRRLSIRRHGLRTRLKVTDHPTDENKLLLFGGHCNFTAGKLEGIKKFKIEYTHFNSNEEVLEAMILENETREKTMMDKVKEMKHWKELHEVPQGYRSDLKAGGVKTDTRALMKEKYNYSWPTIETLLDILDKKPSLINLIDQNMLSVAGAGNVLKYLQENNTFILSEAQMMKNIIEAVIPIAPEINEEYKNSKQAIADLEMAFKRAATKLGALMDKPLINQPQVGVPQSTAQSSDIIDAPTKILPTNQKKNHSSIRNSTKVKIAIPKSPATTPTSVETGVKQGDVFPPAQVETINTGEWELCLRNRKTGIIRPYNGEPGFGVPPFFPVAPVQANLELTE